MEVFHLAAHCNKDENNPNAWSDPRESDFIGMRCRLDVGVLKDPECCYGNPSLSSTGLR